MNMVKVVNLMKLVYLVKILSPVKVVIIVIEVIHDPGEKSNKVLQLEFAKYGMLPSLAYH